MNGSHGFALGMGMGMLFHFGNAPTTLELLKKLGDLKLAFDAMDPSSLTLSGSDVNTWANRGDTALIASVSGVGHAPVLGTDANGINGRPAVRFIPTGKYLQGAFGSSITQPTTDIVVVQIDSVATTGVIIDGDDAAKRHVIDSVGVASQEQLEIYAGAAFNTADNAFVVGTAFILEAVFDGATAEIFVNGVSKATGDCGAHEMDGLTMGSRYAGDFSLSGKIGYYAMYDGELSAADRGHARAQLAAQWGITL